MDKNRDQPTVSVIIPTHNRSASLRRTLDALCVQTYPPQQVEVLVVADGCVDDTAEMLQRYRAPFALHVIDQPGQGAASARNHGAAYATGQLLLFLDDDIEPTPSLIEAHVEAHQRQPGQAVMGPYPPALQGRTEFFRTEVRAWWKKKFHTVGQPGHRYTYRDLLSGNLSLEADLFACVSGFDCAFKDCGGEDYEFGVRLIKAGVQFTFAIDALAYHYEHETMSLDRIFRRLRQEGRSDVLIGLRHRELRPTLGMFRFEAPWLSVSNLLHALVFRWPAAGDRLATWMQRLLNLLERVALRGYWRMLFRALRGYWYWRGVAEKLGTRRALAGFLQGGPARTDESGREIEIDLREGLEAAEQRLNEERPAGVRIRYGKQAVGRIAPQLGAERLRGDHLRPVLATHLARPLLHALALERALDVSVEVSQSLAVHLAQPSGGNYVGKGA